MDSEKHSDFKGTEILEALARIISTTEFKKAYRLRQLLEHLVNKQLAGEEDDLKGYNLGLDVFDKGKDFDPDTDTIVRVQMVRLRRMLEHYYLTTGKNDAIIIGIPKGRYVPAYRQGKNLDHEQHATRVADAANILWRRIKAWVHGKPYWFVFGFGALLLFGWLTSSLLPSFKEPVQKIVMKRENYRMPRGPSVAVFSFNNETGKKEHNALVRGFPAHVIHSLTRFKELFILAPDTTLTETKNQLQRVVEVRGRNLANARNLSVDYALTGGFGISGKKLSLSAFLTRVDSGQIVWSKDFRKELTGTNFHQIQSNIAGSIARELGQPYGVINRLETALRRSSKKLTYTAYECVLQFFEYAHNETEKKHKKVRSCLENTTKTNPGHAQTWAALSWMYVEEHRNGYNVTLDARKSSLDRAYTAARKAIVLDPDDAFNHRRMASVLISRNGVLAAQGSIMRAAELNPNDADVMADVGWILKNTGEWGKAFLYALKAIRLNPGHPPWYLETPILYHYRNQDCQNAFRKAKNYHIQAAKTPLREVFVIVSGMLCEHANVSEHVRKLNRLYPSFLTDPRKLLLDHAVPKELFPEIIAHLQEAGVAVDAKPSKI